MCQSVDKISTRVKNSFQLDLATCQKNLIYLKKSNAIIFLSHITKRN